MKGQHLGRGQREEQREDQIDPGGTMPSARVDVFVFDLARPPGDVDGLSDVLSDDERARAERFLVPVAARQFRVARATLRHVLGGCIGLAPDQIEFEYGDHGKPMLVSAGHAIEFNLSHTGGVGAIAVSRDVAVGVDVEMRRDVQDGLAERFFSSNEVNALHATSAAQRDDAFFRCWTRKEAVIKALGEGFSRPLKSFDVQIEDVPNPKLLRIEGLDDGPSDWDLFSFSPRENVFGAVACRTGTASVAFERRDIAF